MDIEIRPGYSERFWKICTRCMGSGNYSYCQAYGPTCFKCWGRQVIPRSVKQETTVTQERIEKAVVGDIIERRGIHFQILAIKWCPVKRIAVPWGYDYTAQSLTLNRCIDDKICYIRRECRWYLDKDSGRYDVLAHVPHEYQGRDVQPGDMKTLFEIQEAKRAAGEQL